MTEATREAEFERLSRIGWRAEDARAVPADLDPDHRIVRVIAQHRSGYRAHDARDAFPVQAPAGMIRPGTNPLDKPAVGDWVVLAPAAPPLIESLLPRRTLLSRAAAGEHYARQPIASNIDYVLIVCGLDRDYNPRRIERYLVLVEGSGAVPVVVLTKRDLCPEAEQRRAEIAGLIGADARLHLVDSKDPATTQELADYFGPGSTAVLVGSSGAGKSTLTNTLLGREKQKTADVRGHDSRGRHTTTHRALVMLPSGGCLIDTPGMREIKLTGTEDLGETHFADIDAIATHCRFSDCAHRSEPGCAVSAALADGTLDAERYAHYAKLQGEIGGARESAASMAKRKAEEKVLGRALNKRLTEKYGSR